MIFEVFLWKNQILKVNESLIPQKMMNQKHFLGICCVVNLRDYDFFKWAIPGLFYHLFSVFSYKNYNLYNKLCEKCASSIRYRDPNPRPLARESPSITTRPGLRLLKQITSFYDRYGSSKTAITFCNASQIWRLSRNLNSKLFWMIKSLANGLRYELS